MAKKKATTKAGAKAKDTKPRKLVIKPPNFQIAEFRIRGTAPYMQNKFSEKAKAMIRAKQEAGSTGNKGPGKREAKDFDAAYQGAMYKSKEGWCGIPAGAFRNAMISACKVVGFHMTRAKLSVFVIANGFDAEDGTPLVKITKGKPEYTQEPVRLSTGVCDLRARPQWREDWEAVVRVRFDADQFTLEDVANLMVRVGIQVGVGEGRPDSKSSNGTGRGTFEVQGR